MGQDLTFRGADVIAVIRATTMPAKFRRACTYTSRVPRDNKLPAGQYQPVIDFAIERWNFRRHRRFRRYSWRGTSRTAFVHVRFVQTFGDSIFVTATDIFTITPRIIANPLLRRRINELSRLRSFASFSLLERAVPVRGDDTSLFLSILTICRPQTYQRSFLLLEKSARLEFSCLKR